MWPAEPDNETSFSSCPSLGRRSCWKPGPSPVAREGRRGAEGNSGALRQEPRNVLWFFLFSREALELSYTSPVMMLRQVLEPSSHSASGLSNAPSFRRGPPPWVASVEPSRLHALPDFQKQTGAVASPRRSQGFSQARASRSLEVCWQGPGGTCVLSPAARDAAASARPAPLQSASRALSLPACHPQSCDAVSGLHGSDSSVELTA